LFLLLSAYKKNGSLDGAQASRLDVENMQWRALVASQEEECTHAWLEQKQFVPLKFSGIF
jgi:hypothetical protein